jgi:uncharacterized protein YjdB
LLVGDEIELDVTVQPAGTAVSWATSDNTVLSVSDGVVTAEGAGTATVTATAGGLTATFTATVTKPSVTLSDETKEIAVSESFTLTATTVPGSAEITWESDDTAVASVADGVVSGLATGTATISATITVNSIDYSDSCEVTVTE